MLDQDPDLRPTAAQLVQMTMNITQERDKSKIRWFRYLSYWDKKEGKYRLQKIQSRRVSVAWFAELGETIAVIVKVVLAARPQIATFSVLHSFPYSKSRVILLPLKIPTISLTALLLHSFSRIYHTSIHTGARSRHLVVIAFESSFRIVLFPHRRCTCCTRRTQFAVGFSRNHVRSAVWFVV